MKGYKLNIIKFFYYCLYFQLILSYKYNINITVNEVYFQGKIIPAITMNNDIKIGIPLHLQKGEILSLLLKSDTTIRDVSIHWHGFEMKGKQAYDGVVGLTQCAIRPNRPYLYNFTVDEIPGTYWYHTHSGLASGQWHEFIKGPLIVHEDKVPSDAYITPFSYNNERIIFLQDMLKLEPNVGMQNAVGGLSGVITRGRTGDIVGTHPWLGGIINGAENESEGTIINVEPEVEYRFRIINGGDVFAFNFSIPGIKLHVISTDGADLPCKKPIEVDSIFIWTAERYDILVTFPKSLNDQTILYTARTLEPAENGYNHYVNGLIRIGSNAPYTLSKFIPVPKNPIILNCYVGQLASGTCIPFATLSLFDNPYCKQSTSSTTSLLSTKKSSTTSATSSFNLLTKSLSQSFSSSFFETQSEKLLLQKQSQSKSEFQSESEPKSKLDSEINQLNNLNTLENNNNNNNNNDNKINIKNYDDANSKIDPDNTVVHFVDFLFNPPPQYSHMVSLDGGPFTQHVNPFYPLIDPSYPYDIHPSSVLLDLELGKTVIIIMRTSSLMQHPMHFHGHKFEVLDQYTHEYYNDCSIFNCPLTNKYTTEEINRLKNLPYTHILKDTTVIPAGGAVVIRFPANNPGYWLVHCHIGPHKDDGMTFIIHESTKGNTSSPWAKEEKVFIPSDYPICLPKSTQDIYPSCACYHDTDQLTSLRLKHSYICSRDWICHHDKQYNTQLETFVPIYKPGIKMHQLSPQTPVVLSVIFTLVVCIVVSVYCYRSFIASRQDLIHSFSPTTSSSTDLPSTSSAFSKNERYHDEKYSLLRIVIGDDQTPILTEFLAEWELTYRDMINPMRLLEVGGLAVMTGIVFFEVGENHTNRGLRECVSLFFFSVTLWTFTRMYPSIPAHHGWRERVIKRLINKDILAEYQNNNNNSSSPSPLPTPFQIISWRKVLKLSLIRSAVYLCAEGWWPFVFGLIAYPMAHVNGKVDIWFQVIGLIVMNNLCYISFGSVIGTIVPVVQVAMISSTLYSQMSLVCAGFYTTLPVWLSWFRYISYVFYTYSGIVKGVYRPTDSYQCFVGDARVGQDWCLLETAGVIEDMKIRGINTADSGDPNSSNVSLSFGMLICYYCINVLLLYAALLYHIWKTTNNLIAIEQAKIDVANNEDENENENNIHNNGNHNGNNKYSNSFSPFNIGK